MIFHLFRSIIILFYETEKLNKFHFKLIDILFSVFLFDLIQVYTYLNIMKFQRKSIEKLNYLFGS